MALVSRMIGHRNGVKLLRSLSTGATGTDEIHVEERDDKKIITLNRPKALNALNLTMIRAIYPHMKKWNDDPNTSIILIKGAGEKAFCAGGDVVAVTKSFKENTSLHKDFFREEYQLNYLIGTLKVPYVALIDGITMGGGCGLSINGKFRVATERTLLAMPETALGLFPDVGGTHFLNQLKHNLGMFLALTGYRLKGADVFHSGLATHFVTAEQLPALESELLNLPPVPANQRVNQVGNVLRGFQDATVKQGIKPFSLEQHLADIEQCFNANSVEEVLDKLRKSGSEFALAQLKELEKMSPTSMKITFHQIKSGAKLGLRDVFPIEYRLTQRCCADHDFHEGCRAILIDKDRNPKWKPATLSEVTREKVEAYFAPLPAGEELVL
ncbi:Protein F09F7.4 b [Aphelenchoides avenae]|nr:Protein F09F7.4 b [Aphelenchus avenae]